MMKSLATALLLFCFHAVLGLKSGTSLLSNSDTLYPPILPGKGLLQHSFLYAGEWDYRNPLQTLYIVKDGKIAWSYSIPIKDSSGTLQELGDATMLPDRNIVFSRKIGASKITPDKKIIWNYIAPKGYEVHSIEPIGSDKVLIMQNGLPATLMIINTISGIIEKQIILPTGRPSAHGQFRRVRMTDKGTFIAAHMDTGRVVEYDASGKEIWSVNAPSVWMAKRLKNGNTLFTGNQHCYIREVNMEGKVVWEFTQADIPDIKLYDIQEAVRLENGNTLISNWCPNGIKSPKDWPSSVQWIEITRDKKVVWALRQWADPDLGPASSIQLLNNKGLPIEGQQR